MCLTFGEHFSYDNACAESFFATLKKELVHRRHFKTRSQASLVIIEYMIHGITPNEFIVI
ncbi:IS3 family transposase [Metallumcola ferriviriculae]|uniref:IS3 family transposase n=1 Tax=Metallumcola ferriviriculae TaxID=3039180 RepID=UPI003457EDF4